MQRIGNVATFFVSGVSIASAIILSPVAGPAVPPWACKLSDTFAVPRHVNLHVQDEASVNHLNASTGRNEPELLVQEVNRTSLLALMEQPAPLLVVFYAPWCPHCQDFVLDEHGPLEVLNQDFIHHNSSITIVRFNTVKTEEPPLFPVQYIPSIFVVAPNGNIVKYKGASSDLVTLKQWAVVQSGGPTTPEETCNLFDAPIVAPSDAHLHMADQTSLRGADGNGALEAVTAVDRPALDAMMTTEDPFMIVFYASWCKYSRAFVMVPDSPLQVLNQEFIDSQQNFTVVKFDVTKSKKPFLFPVRFVPSIYFVKGTLHIKYYTGNHTDSEGLKDWALEKMGETQSLLEVSAGKPVSVVKEVAPGLAAPVGQHLRKQVSRVRI